MATTASTNNYIHKTADDDEHLEMFCLIWLDANVSKGRDTEQKLRSVINHLKKFQDVNQCQQYIEQRSQQDRIILIVSGRLGREIVPSIHKLRQIISIYVFCMDKKSNEQWACKFPKVKAVVVELKELVFQIETNYKIQKKTEEPLAIKFFNAGKSMANVNGEFLFFQVLIDCLLRLKFNQADKDELVSCLKDEYKDNYVELDNIREFEQKYSADKALWWYTRESFLYKTLNTALRTQNIHMMFLFRTCISDIYHQLQSYQSKCTLKVYRSQYMSMDELKILKQSLGQLISINSFFSTSSDYQRALLFSDVPCDLERVLFEINADPQMAITKPFADISKHSEFADESEILLMLGSIFRLESIDHRNDQIWIIRMTLCSDDEHDLKQVLADMKEQTEKNEINLRTLGYILWDMGKHELAETYFERLLKELPENHPLRGSLYKDLAKLTSQRGDYDKSVQWRKKSMEFEKQNQSTNSSNANKTDESISIVPCSTSSDILAPVESNGKVAVCGGNACAKCGQCCDWYYNGDLSRAIKRCNRNTNMKVFNNDRWFRRNGATCRYSFDKKDDTSLLVSFHHLTFSGVFLGVIRHYFGGDVDNDGYRIVPRYFCTCE